MLVLVCIHPSNDEIDAHRWISRDSKYVSFSRHARDHMEEYDIDTIGIVDMLNDSFPCPPTSRPHRRNLTYVCSYWNGVMYKIVLGEEFCYNIEEDCWVVVNVKPIQQR